MNFFERQRQVRRISVRLVVLFALAVAGTVAVVDLAVWFVIGVGSPAETVVTALVVASVLTVALIGLSSLFKSISLRRGGGARVAESLGGTAVPPDTRDPDLRRLRNVVEEIAIASGTPVPALYVLEKERGINAFAAGWSPADAAVAVTRGSLDRLNRDELQGVIAHEFSHVVNGDMRLNIKLMGLLFGLLVLFVVGRVLTLVRGGNRNPTPLIGLALIIAGAIGMGVGRIIQAAVSRQREYLADATAVQYTRQTAGLVGALKKIAGLKESSAVRNPRADEVGHMLFGSAKGLKGQMLATHPPLIDRIRVLEPNTRPEELEQLRRQWATRPPSGAAEDRAMGLADGSTRVSGQSGSGTPGRGHVPGGAQAPGSRAPGEPRTPAGAGLGAAADPAAVVAAIGGVEPDALDRAGRLLDRIPEHLRVSAHETEGSVSLVLALVLSAHPDVRAAQLAAVGRHFGEAAADEVRRAGQALTGLPPELRLPLAELAFPALQRRTPEQQDAIMATLHDMIAADGRLDVVEYCLSRLLHEQLHEARHHRPSWAGQRYSVAAARTATATLLAVLADAGHDDSGHDDARPAARAFAAGLGRLPGDWRGVAYAPPAAGVVALEHTWGALDGMPAHAKQQLIEAVVTVIGHDGRMTVSELELLRTICAMLHCPLPPVAQAPGRVA
ncbi:M48 family metalloprotease [Myceligenerans pegani]|uniref:M48 family metalloprotease n=1 Tax=Myceligenerans pegani TaxID=2776917 RepID=A0ABR9MV35_9MICO|nr:M48 family metalloprotease [Myceligenerans sp. TRM 65318]MBE1874901.1 M48 family metalloprotease [Myceligenerans sp. TRM 65318]MBE3017172.1 M48 family metalloprotease [Myceligenerans sp. TRM 65318]